MQGAIFPALAGCTVEWSANSWPSPGAAGEKRKKRIQLIGFKIMGFPHARIRVKVPKYYSIISPKPSILPTLLYAMIIQCPNLSMTLWAWDIRQGGGSKKIRDRILCNINGTNYSRLGTCTRIIHRFLALNTMYSYVCERDSHDRLSRSFN